MCMCMQVVANVLVKLYAVKFTFRKDKSIHSDLANAAFSTQLNWKHIYKSYAYALYCLKLIKFEIIIT